MNKEEIAKWQDCVVAHNQSKAILDKDKEVLREHIKDHLDNFFEDYTYIQYSNDLWVVTLTWYKQHYPVIRKNIGDLGMEFCIVIGQDESAYPVVKIKIYPFGIPDGGD